MASSVIAARTDSPAVAEGDSALAERLERAWGGPPTLWGWLTTVDHKKIGRRYLVTALLFLLVGGGEALLMRLQLIGPERRTLSPEAYNQLFTMHGLTMIMWYAAPVLSGFGNFLVPLLIGVARHGVPAAQRLQLLDVPDVGAAALRQRRCSARRPTPAGSPTCRSPASAGTTPGLNMDFYATAMTALTISTTVGAINFIVTIFKHRAPGMTPARMPLLLYSTGTTSFLAVLALPALTAACVFLELDRRWGTHFFDPRHGGDPLLWQHLFWFFGHPWVYIVFLPATGMISMLLPVYARRPIVGHPLVAASTVLTGVVGMGVWVHHMFAVGMAQMAMSFFSAASMTISLFSTIQIFCWVATLWLGRPVRTDVAAVRAGVHRHLRHRRPVRRDHRGDPVRLAGARHLLRRGAPALRAHRRQRLSGLRRPLLLVAQADRARCCDERARQARASG